MVHTGAGAITGAMTTVGAYGRDSPGVSLRSVTRTIEVTSVLPAGADRVWEAMQQPASFLYVCRGLLGLPGLAGRTDAVVEGETGTNWLMLFHVIPLHRHTIHVVRVSGHLREIETEEHGGVIRRWHHVLRVRPGGGGTSRYSDTVDIDAGVLTPVVAVAATVLYRYRQRRWRRLARRHLQRPATPCR